MRWDGRFKIGYIDKDNQNYLVMPISYQAISGRAYPWVGYQDKTANYRVRPVVKISSNYGK